MQQEPRDEYLERLREPGLPEGWWVDPALVVELIVLLLFWIL